ncbi:MAG: epoxide hydrolase family protein [Phenylobacterium sp.]
MSKPQPFEVRWEPSDVEAVMDRVRAYPWPPQPAVPDGWAYGCDGAYLRELCAHWTNRYNWRAAMADLNRFDQFTARVEDYDIHFLHVVGEADGKRPLILTHGWPGSHYEFWQVIEKLAYPSRFGGSAADAFDLVIPSLPGFGFSSKPTRPIGQRTTARLFNTLMTQVLGYQSYLAQGGDWGAMVTSWLGRDHGANARAIHLNMLGFRPHGGPEGEAEIAWATKQAGAMEMMGAYFRLQVSKPQSIAWMGAGNPVGQAAWIAERFHDWSDLSTKTMDEAYPKDRLLTNIMLYVMTESFTTGAWYYRGLVEEGGLAFAPGERLETPTAFANFPGEPLYSAPPRSFAERAYNIARWTDMPRGGHFAAMEEPDLFADEVRSWAREVAGA